MKSKVKSPITGSDNVRLNVSIPVSDIVESYKNVKLPKIEKYFTKVENVDIYECLDTGYRFYHPFTVFGDDKFYEYLQNSREHYSHLRWEHNPALAEVNKDTKLLEIGSGDGDFLHMAAKEALEVKGLEFNDKAIKKNKEKGLTVYRRSIEDFSKDNKEYFDIVCTFQVLEHICYIDSFVSAALDALKPGGKLIIGVPNNNPYLFRHDMIHALNLPPHHSGLWSKKALRNLAKYYGLQVEKIITEPITSEANYYWKVNKQHWKKSNKSIYKPVIKIGDKFPRLRKWYISRFCQGRNVLAILKKV